MRDRPAGPELAALVARARAGDPALAVPEDARYRELMMARALAIAERQGEAGDEPERREAEALARILGRGGSLAELHRALAAAIREGVYDAGVGDPGTDARDAVRRFLRDSVIRRVAESNPKALPGDDGA